MSLLDEIIMAVSFWFGIMLCYTIDWYLEVYGNPFRKRDKKH